jgi:hypothetical protein
MATLPNGQIYPGKPALHPGFVQNVEGGILKAATTSTLEQQAINAAAVQKLGAGQKGAGRRTKRRKARRGGGGNVVPLSIPTANTIAGVHPENNQIAGVNTLNHLRTGAMYDHLANAAPYKLGGFRLRGPDDEELAGGRKRRRKTKKHGRSNKRSSRRSSRKSNHSSRRRNRRV